MKFGIREICNVVFRSKAAQRIGGKEFKMGQPVFYIDTAKTSTLENSTTAVYATGGRGNARLITWEGDKTLTFTVEDALLSPTSFAMLTGAGLVKNRGHNTDDAWVHVHMLTDIQIDHQGVIHLAQAVGSPVKVGDDDDGSAHIARENQICREAPIYIMKLDEDGSLTGEFLNEDNDDDVKEIREGSNEIVCDPKFKNTNVKVDYYITKKGTGVSELQMTPDAFATTYYVEAETLVRSQYNGRDYPAVFTLPNVKILSNFTFNMAASGDPSTFTFTMEAMPGFTYFDRTKKVLCVLQIIEDKPEGEVDWYTLMEHTDDEKIDINDDDEDDNNDNNKDDENAKTKDEVKDSWFQHRTADQQP